MRSTNQYETRIWANDKLLAQFSLADQNSIKTITVPIGVTRFWAEELSGKRKSKELYFDLAAGQTIPLKCGYHYQRGPSEAQIGIGLLIDLLFNHWLGWRLMTKALPIIELRLEADLDER